MDPYLDSGEWRALVAAIRFDPNDDTCRLAVADWLQECDPDDLRAWGSFIRCQVERVWIKRDHVFNDSCDCEVCRVERRSLRLHDEWGYHWFTRSLAGIDTKLAVRIPVVPNYKRGFVEEFNAVYSDWKVDETPVLVRNLFERTPLARAAISLNNANRGPAVAAYFHPDNNGHYVLGIHHPEFQNRTREYALGVTVSPVGAGKYLRAKAELAADPDAHSIASSRLVSPGSRLGRAISGAVRSVLEERHNLSERLIGRIPQPAGVDLGGEA